MWFKRFRTCVCTCARERATCNDSGHRGRAVARAMPAYGTIAARSPIRKFRHIRFLGSCDNVHHCRVHWKGRLRPLTDDARPRSILLPPAQLFALEVIARDVTDHPEAETRFVVVGREPSPRTGRDKTSLIAFISEDKPGALLEILQEFADRGINLTKLESRPTKRVLAAM